MKYSEIANTLIIHKSSDYVNFKKYIDYKNSNKINKLSYILHDYLMIASCDRMDDDKRETNIRINNYNLNNIYEFEEWIQKEDYRFPRLKNLIDLYELRELHFAFQKLFSRGLIAPDRIYANSISVQYPVHQQMLSLPYAYVKLLSYLKKQHQVKNAIINKIKNLDVMLRKKYKKFNKNQLLDLLVDKQVKPYDLKKINYKSPIFKLIIKELTNYELPELIDMIINKYNKESKDYFENTYDDFFAELQSLSEEYLEDQILSSEDIDESKKEAVNYKALQRNDFEKEPKITINDLLYNQPIESEYDLPGKKDVRLPKKTEKLSDLNVKKKIMEL